MNRRDFNAGAASLLCVAGTAMPSLARGQPAQKVTLGVGGKPLLYYLPLTVAEKKGYFQQVGLDVEINDFGSGAKALQALVGGSVDVATSDYAHTIYMQMKGQDVRAIVELGRLPSIVVAVRKELAGRVKSAADFKGLKLGVTAPGSVSASVPLYAMVKAGLQPSDVAVIGVGSAAGAVAAIQQGQVDLLSHLDPAITKLEDVGAIRVLIDTRTEKDTLALFGGLNPAATCYTRAAFIEGRPDVARRLVKAFLMALEWLQGARPEDVANLVPPEYLLGDRPLYLQAVKANLPTYSRTGICDPKGMASAYGMMKALDPAYRDTNIDLAKTFDARFVKA